MRFDGETLPGLGRVKRVHPYADERREPNVELDPELVGDVDPQPDAQGLSPHRGFVMDAYWQFRGDVAFCEFACVPAIEGIRVAVRWDRRVGCVPRVKVRAETSRRITRPVFVEMLREAVRRGAWGKKRLRCETGTKWRSLA